MESSDKNSVKLQDTPAEASAAQPESAVKTAQPKKPLRTLLIVSLLILALAVTGLMTGWFGEIFGTPPNSWLGDYYASHNELTKAQLKIINNSAKIISSVAEDAGVKVTLVSATGDGFYSTYKLDIELPEAMNAGEGYHFGNQRLLINDESIGLGTKGTSSMTLEDDNPTDNRYSMLVSIRLTNYPVNRNYSFNNGIVRTLRLENIVADESGKIVNLIEGQWDFGVLFTNEGKTVELIDEPVTISGYGFWDKKWFEAKVTSFVLSSFSAYCEYELSADSASSAIGISPVVVLKDGRKFALMPSSCSDYNCNFSLTVPVSLDELEYVQLTDDVILPVS